MSRITMSNAFVRSLFSRAKAEFARRRAAAKDAVEWLPVLQDINIIDCNMKNRVGWHKEKLPTSDFVWKCRRPVAWMRGFFFLNKTPHFS